MASDTSTDAHAAMSQTEHPTSVPSNSKRKEARARHRREKTAQKAAEANKNANDMVEKTEVTEAEHVKSMSTQEIADSIAKSFSSSQRNAEPSVDAKEGLNVGSKPAMGSGVAKTSKKNKAEAVNHTATSSALKEDTSSEVSRTQNAKSLAEQCTDGGAVPSSAGAATCKPWASMCDQSCENLYVTIRQQRQQLFQGPKITVHAGSTAVTDIYIRVAMAASPVLHKYFVENPEHLEYSFQAHIAPGAVRYLLDTWMQDIRDVFEVYAVPAQDSFIKNVSLLRAARMLGMEQYVRPILDAHVNYLKNNLPTYEQIAVVESSATSDKDPLWTSMVNHLCHDRYKQMMPDPEVFTIFLEEHPRLKAAMASADAYFSGAAKKKWEHNQAEWQARENGRRALWVKKQAEKAGRVAKEQEVAESPGQDEFSRRFKVDDGDSGRGGVAA